MSLYVDDCIKVDARLDTLVNPFREVFNSHPTSVWSLCGPTAELEHLTEIGFITPEQYVGVDNNVALIEENRRKHPEARWIHGEFGEVIQQHLNTSGFNPDLVNYDSTSMETGVETTRFLLSAMGDPVNEIDHVMLVANLVLETRHRKLSDDAMPDMIASIPRWEEFSWQIYCRPDGDGVYAYGGGERAHSTKMQTWIFWKP